MGPLKRQMACRALFNRRVYQTRGSPNLLNKRENSSYFKGLLAAMEIEGSALMERQFPQEWQIDAGLTRKVVVDGVCMLIRLVGQFEQRQREIRRDRHVEFGCAEGRNGDGTVADAARDLLPANSQFRVQPANRQRTVVRIFNVELNGEILLQQISAAHLDADDGDVRPRKFGRDQRTAAEETQRDGQ
jgi:hypothetical protein